MREGTAALALHYARTLLLQLRTRAWALVTMEDVCRPHTLTPFPPPILSPPFPPSHPPQVREFPKPWEQARRIDLPGSASEHTVEGLFPTSTFEFRIVAVGADGARSAPGPATSADTLAAGCTPKGEGKKKEKCAVM
jgi:hypothetical protein